MNATTRHAIMSLFRNEKDFENFKETFFTALNVIRASHMKDSEIGSDETRHYFLKDEVRHLLTLYPDIASKLGYGNGTAVTRELYRKYMERYVTALEDELEAWYKNTWKKKNLDFRVPKNPNSLELVTINPRMYHCGGLTIVVERNTHEKEVIIMAQGARLDSFIIDVPRISLIEDEIKKNKAFFLRIASLTDWSKFNTFTREQQNALAKRYRIVKKYYYNKSEYIWMLHSFELKRDERNK